MEAFKAMLLKETEQIYMNTETEFNEAIQNRYPERYVQEKELVQRRNLKVRISLEKRRRKKWRNFLCRAKSSTEKRNVPLIRLY